VLSDEGRACGNWRRRPGISGLNSKLADPTLFRFTKIWEKVIVIIGSKWTESIVIGQDEVEPMLA
jgi:hypothetical protein